MTWPATPNPGSERAIAQGCICPVLDNCHGKFAPYGEPNGWIITMGCPIHHKPTESENP